MSGNLQLAPPNELARRFEQGELDAALLSSWYALDQAGSLRVVDGVAIGADGDVFSVILAYRGRLEEVRTLHLDPASLSSVRLLRVVLPELTTSAPQLVTGPAPEGGARVLIGDPAIAFRRACGPEWQIVDLAGTWKRLTGLPFVFAVWVIRRDYGETDALAALLRAAKQIGLGHLNEIVEASSDPDFSRQYLAGNIRYDLGVREKAGLDLFRSRLQEQQLLDPSSAPLEFV